MNDDELSALLRETHPKVEFPASFQREVWARIAVAEQQSISGRWGQFLLWLARPAPALAVTAITLGLGIGLGSLGTPNQSEAMRVAYSASINPIKAAHIALRP